MADEPILIKKYGNRKLYDSSRSRYITLEEIAKLIREGKQVRVLDSVSHEDLTSVTLTQIILEEEKKRKNHLPVSFLHHLIQYGQSLQHLFQRQLLSNLHTLMTTQAQARELWREWLARGWAPVMGERQDSPEFHQGHLTSEPNASLKVELASLRESLERLERKIHETQVGWPRDE